MDAIYEQLLLYNVHHATKVMHGILWCEKYQCYMCVFNSIYNEVLLSTNALVTKRSGTGAQPNHSNDLSNISNQTSHLTFCLTHDCWSLSTLTQTLSDGNELYGINQP